MKIPKTIGACADQLYALRAARLKAQKVVDKLAAEESILREHVINTLPKSHASGVAGKFARVSVVTKQVPQVEDWNKFYAHIKRTGDFDLLQRRLGDKAIQERWENRKQVPGVKSFTAVMLSVVKA